MSFFLRSTLLKQGVSTGKEKGGEYKRIVGVVITAVTLCPSTVRSVPSISSLSAFLNTIHTTQRMRVLRSFLLCFAHSTIGNKLKLRFCFVAPPR